MNDKYFELSKQELERLRTGDDRLQLKVFDKYADKFVHLTQTKWKISVEESEEIVSTAFMTFFCDIQKEGHKIINPSGYVYNSVKWQALKQIEKEKNNPIVLPGILPPAIAMPPVIIGNYHLDLINIAFNRLKDTYKRILCMYYWKGMKHKEIGDVLGISEDASKSHLSESKKKLRVLMNHIKSQKQNIVADPNEDFNLICTKY